MKTLKLEKILPLIVFLAGFLMYSSNIDNLSIYILDEARNAECAREMLEQNDFITPTFNYQLRTDKPVLHYYFMIAGYSIFGVNEFGARFFSSLFGALTLLFSFLFVKRFAGIKTAMWLVFVLLSSLHFSLEFHLAVPDPYLIFFISLALMCFYAFMQDGNGKYLLGLYVSIGFGVLTKGPVAIALPGLIFILYLIFTQRFRWTEIKKLRPFLGAALVLLIALPWYILVGIKTNGEWLEGFFFKHNLSRFSATMHGHDGTFLAPLVFLIIGFLPFFTFFPQIFRYAFKNRKDSHLLLFALIVTFVFIGFFSISQTRLPNYIMPAYPFMAILVASFFRSVFDGEIRFKGARISFLVYTVLITGIPIALYLTMKMDPVLESKKNYALWFIILPVAGFISFIYSRKKLLRSVVIQGVSHMVISLLFFYSVYPAVDKENAVSKALQIMNIEKEIRYFKLMNPAFLFYMRKPVEKIKEPQEVREFFDAHPDAYVITTREKYRRFLSNEGYEIIFSQHDIFNNSASMVLQNPRREN